MKTRSISAFIIILLLTSCHICSNVSMKSSTKTFDATTLQDTADVFGSKVYKHLSPNQFLDYLVNLKVGPKGLNIAVFAESPSDWIKRIDIDTLILRIYDTTRIPCVVNPFSSYLPTKEHSCIGREAQNMIKSYIEKKGYLNFLYSYGSVDSIQAKDLIDWYKSK
jgi:hypothetical protein